MVTIHAIFSKIKHKLHARHRKGHSIHSPYLFRFVNNVVFEDKQYYAYDEINNLYNKLSRNSTSIITPAIGTQTKDKKQKIKQILKQCSKPQRQSQLLHRICVDANAKTIIELGTNLGISSIYMSKCDTQNSKVYTFEGSSPLIKIAKQNFAATNSKNIEIIEGNIDNTLDNLLKKINEIDIVFFDANHNYTSTLKYYNICKTKIHNNTIFIFDDIHRNSEMEMAWAEIKKSNITTTTFDLYDLGIVWFNPHLPKRNYIIPF